MTRAVCDHTYSVYGVTVYSDVPLSLPQNDYGELAAIEVRMAPASFFEETLQGIALQQPGGSAYEFAWLDDGSIYARWKDAGEFLVAPHGGRIACRQFDHATPESFQIHLLGQGLSLALVRRGFEPLNATVIVADGTGIAFIGDAGFGKSTLAASFLGAGYRMLTDKLLIARPTPQGILGYPGPPRIKLSDSENLILPLSANETCPLPVLIKSIYILAEPSEAVPKQSIRVESLSRRLAFSQLAQNTFNSEMLNPDTDRMKRQLSAMARIVEAVPVKRVTGRIDLNRLPAIRETILSDFRPVTAAAPR